MPSWVSETAHHFHESSQLLKSRIPLTDGDKKAYSESSQWAIQQKKDLISQLRAENKMLRAKLSRKMKVLARNDFPTQQMICPPPPPPPPPPNTHTTGR